MSSSIVIIVIDQWRTYPLRFALQRNWRIGYLGLHNHQHNPDTLDTLELAQELILPMKLENIRL
jgi:hypothetical protein